MKNHFGKIKILSIENIPDSNLNGSDSFLELKDKDIRFVHYSDCQQLIIYLPQNGDCYGNLRLIKTIDNNLVEEWPVSDRLNGSIQILWDTLYLNPGEYNIEIELKNSLQKHKINVIKYEENGNHQELILSRDNENHQKESETIIYKDGNGKVLANEDLNIIEKLQLTIASNFSRKIEYEGSFREGTIIYIEGDLKIRFDHEMGGGNCMFYVIIPNEEKWEAVTKTLLNKRNDILQFIAETLKREQANSCKFEITSNQITFNYY